MRFGVMAVKAVLCLGFLSAPAFAEIGEILGSADAEDGKRVFRKCVACHTVDKVGKKRTGPNLYGIVGASVAAREGFKYSSALSAFGGDWTIERLDTFLAAPRKAVKGTRMTFAGLKKPDDRADLILYLNTQSDEPMELGGSEQAIDATSVTNDEPEFGVLKVAEGAEATYYACTACHSEMIVAQQGLSLSHWDELLEWMVDEQGMNEIDEPDRSLILDYLATHYGEDRPNFPGAKP